MTFVIGWKRIRFVSDHSINVSYFVFDIFQVGSAPFSVIFNSFDDGEYVGIIDYWIS